MEIGWLLVRFGRLWTTIQEPTYPNRMLKLSVDPIQLQLDIQLWSVGSNWIGWFQSDWLTFYTPLWHRMLVPKVIYKSKQFIKGGMNTNKKNLLFKFIYWLKNQLRNLHVHVWTYSSYMNQLKVVNIWITQVHIWTYISYIN